MDDIRLSDLLANFDITAEEAASIIADSGAEVLADDIGDLFVLRGEATAALMAAGRFPLIRGCDPAADAVKFVEGGE